MKLACPESHRRSVSRCGNITGSESGSGVRLGVVVELGLRGARMACAAELRHGDSQSTKEETDLD